MSGVQCANCGKVGPASQMHTEYVPASGDCVDPGDPVWVHSNGFGCAKTVELDPNEIETTGTEPPFSITSERL